MDIHTQETVETKENLENKKPWFNGAKTFTSVKVTPVPLNSTPPDLGIHITENVNTEEKLGQ